MARAFAKTGLKVFSINGDTGCLNLVGSATVKVNNEVVDNSALLDDWKLKDIMAGEWSMDVEQAVDSAMTTDLVALAAAKTAIAIVVQVKNEAGTTSILYNAGTAKVESAENVIEGAIRQRGTLVGIGALTVTTT